MGYDSSLRKRVQQLARSEREKLKEEDIYRSRELLDYLYSLSASMMGDRGELSSINIFEGDPKGDTAWTTGSAMAINWRSSSIWYYPTPEQRFMAFMGLFFHEKAHDLFSDFNEELRAMSFLRNGQFCGNPPSNLTPQEDADWADMVTSMTNPAARRLFVEVFKELTNIMDDVHDENALIDVYGSFVSEGIYKCQSSLHATCPLFEDMSIKALQGEGSDLQLAYNLLLQQARFGYALCRDEDLLKNSKFGEMLESVSHHVEIACATDDIMRRFSELNYVMLALWPFIRAQMQQSKNKPDQSGNGGNQVDPNQQQTQSGQGQSQQSSSQGQSSGQSQQSQQSQQNQSPSGSGLTEEQVDKILGQLKKTAEQAGKSKAPEKKKSSQEAINRRASERKGEKEQKKQAAQKDTSNKQQDKNGSHQAIYNILKRIQDQIAEAKAEEKVEAEAKQALVDVVAATDQTSPHKGIPLTFQRQLSVSESERQVFEDTMKDLKSISKRLQRQVADALRDLKEGFVSRHKVAGKMLMVNDAYRPDGRCFANKKLPQDLPDMAISVLVDHSGSMLGDRIETAMKASMLLYDFARGLDIPISIAGHRSSTGYEVDYIMYTDFDDISGNDKYRIAKMSAAGNNRDGMALNIAAGLLDKRPEQVKLLIIISDGRPNHTNYGGEAAAKDIQEIIRNCKRKGIEVIAAAIGDDKENIQAIYQDEFLDISDLSKLPKIMTNIVKKRVLRNSL